MSAEVVEGAAPGDSLGDALVRAMTSSIGAKVVMAVTGLGLVGFVVVHLLGNLLMYSGPAATNAYAAALHKLGLGLWALRAGLILAAGLHIWAGIRSTRLDQAARPVAYRAQKSRVASVASRYMALSGLLLLAYLVLHLAHFTFGWIDPAAKAFTDPIDPLRADVYRMTVVGFQHPLFTGIYVVAQLLLGLHLSHGISSMFQHLGLFGRRFSPALRIAGAAVAWTVALAFLSIPLAVLFGVVK